MALGGDLGVSSGPPPRHISEPHAAPGADGLTGYDRVDQALDRVGILICGDVIRPGGIYRGRGAHLSARCGRYRQKTNGINAKFFGWCGREDSKVVLLT